MNGTGERSMPQEHIVVSGETFSKIAARYGLTVGELKALNPQIKNINKILKGEKIKLPVQSATAPETSAPATPAAAPAAAPQSASSAMPDTTHMSGVQAFAVYAPYLRDHGVDPDAMKANVKVILGLRCTTNVRANNGRGLYDDRIILVWKDASGAGHAAEYEANTEPSGRYEDTPEHRKLTPGKIMGEDGDADGCKDLGCLPDGLYRYHKDHSEKGNILRPDHNIYVVRDVNHDGVFNEVDDQRVLDKERLNSYLTILFHAGGANLSGSAGCQTFPPKDFAKFWAALGTQKKFDYVLTTVG
jgi:hypothetical protein